MIHSDTYNLFWTLLMAALACRYLYKATNPANQVWRSWQYWLTATLCITSGVIHFVPWLSAH